VAIPFQDRLAGMSLATSAAFAKANPEVVAGYCRAMTKALVFTKTNPEAAVRIFWEEFPNTKPANLDEATALKNSVHIMKRFLEMALQGLPEDSRIGDFVESSWKNSHTAFTALGNLKGTDAYTPQFIEACNAFDRAAIVAQAKATAR
jgi:NitT/TauT family transport system substrate-binding protein